MLSPECRSSIRRHHGVEESVLEKLPSAKECALAGRPTSEAYVYRKVGF